MASSSSTKRPKEEENSFVVPKDFTSESGSAVCVQFHPEQDILGLSTIKGNVVFCSVSEEGQVREFMNLELHKKSARCLQFSQDGLFFATASKDRSFTVNDFTTGKNIMRMSKAHQSSIFCLYVLSEHSLATGDEDGEVKVWDKRHPGGPVCEFSDNNDVITDIKSDSERKKVLINTSGDGTITAHDMRKKSLLLQSETFDAELLCMAKMKTDTKVICGAGDGSVQIFNWGEWGNISDRIPSYTDHSIDTMVPVTDQIVLAGSFDGTIRALSIYPNKVLEVVGSHGDFPIESMSVSQDNQLLASSSHDDVVKFYDVRKFDDMFVEMPTKKSKKEGKSKAKKGEFFADL